MIDYNAIVQNLTEERVIEILTKLGADHYKNVGNALVFPTICHNEQGADASDKLYYYKDTHRFYCYTECGGMSIFTFLEHYYQTNDIEYEWYEDIYKVITNKDARPLNEIVPQKYQSLKSSFGAKSKYVVLPEYSPNVLDCFQNIYTNEWLSEGITIQSMQKYNIKYSISQNKIIIPHYDIDGRLIGIRGRALNEIEAENFGKYMPVQIEGVWYKHPLSFNLYGLYNNKDNIKNSKICYVFEGEKSVLLCDSFDAPNCAVATCGSNINKYQLNLLLKHCAPSEIVICFDKEEKPKEDKYFYKLYNMCKKYSNYCNFSFVYDKSDLLNLKQSPVDNGEEVFNEMIRKRVKVY